MELAPPAPPLPPPAADHPDRDAPPVAALVPAAPLEGGGRERRAAGGVRNPAVRLRQGQPWGEGLFSFVEKVSAAGCGYEATCSYHKGTETAPRCRKYIKAESASASDMATGLRMAKDRWHATHSTPTFYRLT